MKIEIPLEIIKEAKEFGMIPEELARRILLNWAQRKHAEITVSRISPAPNGR